MYVVSDTGILLQASLNPFGPAERALRTTAQGQCTGLVSNRLRNEYETVLYRPVLEARFPRLVQSGIREAQLARVDDLFERVPNAPEHIEYRRDPNNTHIINLAIDYQVGFIVTRDKDLLSLSDDPLFAQLCPTTRLVNPFEFLQIVQAELPNEAV
jgi:putative PIN family toxin of toxin-antitoxin system